MRNILITSAGQRVSLVRSFQKELRRYDNNAKVYTVDLNPILAPACHIADGYREIVKVTDSEYIEKLLDISLELNIGMIIPTIDTELLVLATHKNIFEKHGISVIISSVDLVQILRDKRLTNNFFTRHGINIPKQIDKTNPVFPLFIKPYDGSLSKDTFIIYSQEELRPYHYANAKLMFMEYIDPSKYKEFTVDTYYDRTGTLCCAVPRERIFVRSGEINKGATRKNGIISLLNNKLHVIEGAVGCLTMQFFYRKEDNEIIGIEINPRFGGGYPLSYLAGANFPKWLIQEYFQNKEVEYTDLWRDNLLMLRYDDEILVEDYGKK
jgi:carbamoyl-phosphate synthase large subunit